MDEPEGIDLSDGETVIWDPVVRAVEYRLAFEMVRARITQALLIPAYAERVLMSALEEIEAVTETRYPNERERSRQRVVSGWSSPKTIDRHDANKAYKELIGPSVKRPQPPPVSYTSEPPPEPEPAKREPHVLPALDRVVPVGCPISKSQLAVLELLASGRSSEQICSEDLYISPSTLKKHLYMAGKNLGVPAQQEVMVAIAIRKGWIRPTVPKYDGLIGPLDSDHVEIIELMAKGLEHAEVGEQLGIPVGTIKSRVLAASRRLGLGTTRKPYLVSVALLNGWIT